MSEKAKQSMCKANLHQFGKGHQIYFLDFGKQTKYAQKSGQGFILSLYKSRILTEPEVYICPSAEEHHMSSYEIKSAADKFDVLPDAGDAEGPVSYAGRKNANQDAYPGIFKLEEDIGTTPIASDDIGESHNHEQGRVLNFLFLDGHVDHKRLDHSYQEVTEWALEVLAN